MVAEGCTEAQGFLLARPVAAEDILRVLTKDCEALRRSLRSDWGASGTTRGETPTGRTAEDFARRSIKANRIKKGKICDLHQVARHCV